MVISFVELFEVHNCFRQKYKLILLMVAFMATSIIVSAQKTQSSQRVGLVVNYSDSVIIANIQQLIALSDSIKNKDVTFSPYMYRISEPNTYYRNALKSIYALDWKSQYDEDKAPISSDGMMYRTSLNRLIDQALVGAYMSNPENFMRYDEQFDNVELLKENRVEKKHQELDAILTSSTLVGNVADVIEDVKFDIEATKPNFWKKSGKFTTQFTQSYFSQNWYKGGSNNVTLLSTLLLEANYNDQKSVQWDNKIDLRLGFVSTPADEHHKFMTNNDKIYLATKLGVKATKAWYYTIQSDVNSQFLPGYRTNKKETFSKFLAPLDVFVSIGMDFKPTLKKGSFSAAFLPLSYKMRYIHGDDENNTIHNTYAMMKNEDDGTKTPLTTKHDFGSKVELNAKFEIVKNFTWRSRAYYYTTYKYAEAEWENALSFQFNKYLSTEVNALWRFDDNRSPKTKEGHSLGYFQFKEYFTFGLSYNF